MVGDHSGLFGRGTSGEGCDTDDLELPGVQRELVERVVATGTPTVLVVLSGRPYAIDWALASCAAVVQAFFPGEEGGPALAGVLSGRVNPSGRLPVSLPRSAGAQPYTYLHPRLGGDVEVSSVATRPALPFGHGLSYTSFRHEPVEVAPGASTRSGLRASVQVTNAGAREGAEVVQLYGRDVTASVTRPLAQLLGFARVVLGPGESTVVDFDVPPARLAFTGRDGRRVVEPGTTVLWSGTCAPEPGATVEVELAGPVHPVGLEGPRRTTTRCR